MKVAVQNAIKEANNIILNEIGLDILKGIYWALVPSNSPDLKYYTECYNKVRDAGFVNNEIMTRYNSLVSNGTVFLFPMRTITEFINGLYSKKKKKADFMSKIVSNRINMLKQKEMVELAKYLKTVYFSKNKRKITIGIFNTSGSRNITKDFKVDSGEYANKTVRTTITAFALEMKDMLMVNKNYLNAMGFKVADVQFLDMYQTGECCTVMLTLEPTKKLKMEEESEGDNIEDMFDYFDQKVSSSEVVATLETSDSTQISGDEEGNSDGDDVIDPPDEDDDYDFGDLG